MDAIFYAWVDENVSVIVLWRVLWWNQNQIDIKYQ